MANAISKTEMDAAIEKRAQEIADNRIATMRAKGEIKPKKPLVSSYILHGDGHPMKFDSCNATMQHLELHAPHKMEQMKSEHGGMMKAKEFHKQLVLILGK